MIEYQPHPVRPAVYQVYPGNLLNMQNMATSNEVHDDYDGLDELFRTPASTPTQQYFDIASGPGELDLWRRNANGPGRASEDGVNGKQPAVDP